MQLLLQVPCCHSLLPTATVSHSLTGNILYSTTLHAACNNGQYLHFLLQLLFCQQKRVVHQIPDDLVDISAMEPNLCEFRRLNLHD